MRRDEARAAKAELADYAREVMERRVRASTADTGRQSRAGDLPLPPLLSLGLAPVPDGGFQVAVRYRLGVPTARMLARKVVDHADGEVDVRRTGRIRTTPPARPRADATPRPPVVTAQAIGETGRARPLRPGVSIAHVDVSAGTLGAFVRVGGVLHALSNHHVLAGTPTARPGDAVLQPGPADGGRDPHDRIGTLAAAVPLDPVCTARVDAAVALLDDLPGGPLVDPTYPVGRLSDVGEVLGAEVVEKVGRTTGVTRGRVTAIELDGLVVGFGAETGDLNFDDQIEVEGLGAGPFSRGGDSGSLVYLPETRTAVGLLFAGSKTGGENGAGLTYVNPIGTVLASLGAELVT